MELAGGFGAIDMWCRAAAGPAETVAGWCHVFGAGSVPGGFGAWAGAGAERWAAAPWTAASQAAVLSGPLAEGPGKDHRTLFPFFRPVRRDR